MKNIYFEKSLPNGYKLAESFSLKEKRGSFSFISAAIFFGIIFVGLIPCFINLPKFDDVIFFLVVYFSMIAFLLAGVLHDCIHGLLFKILTKGKLIASINRWNTDITNPNVFTYNNATVIIRLAPTVVCIALALPAMVFSYIFSPGLYMTILLTFAVLCTGGIDDFYTVYLVLKKYKDKQPLVNYDGTKTTVFVYDESNTVSNDEKTNQFLLDFSSEEKKEAARKKNASKSKTSSICSIVVFAIGALIYYALIVLDDKLLYAEEKSIFQKGAFWLFIASLILIALCAATIKKFVYFKTISSVFAILIAPILIIFAFATSSNGYISHTTDISNYGVYDDHCYVPDFFPEEISEEMTPVAYSYYFDNYWDTCYEVYLEVKMTDAEYNSYKDKYKTNLVDSWYNEKYKEYVIKDYLNLYRNEDGDIYANSPNIKKILFNDEENIVVFWVMQGLDPFYFENSIFFERFDVDPNEYDRRTRETEEKK